MHNMCRWLLVEKQEHGKSGYFPSAPCIYICSCTLRAFDIFCPIVALLLCMLEPNIVITKQNIKSTFDTA